MPCYNEETCIEKVVREWIGMLSARVPALELVVVDDGSRDSTGAILDRLAAEFPLLRVIHQSNAGHGSALRRALEEARGEWVFHVDSDDQFHPSDFWKLWQVRENYDYLCGHRIERHDPLHRLVITRIVRLLNGILFGLRLNDPNIPFKMLRRSALQRILELVPPGVFAPSIMMSVVGKRLFRLCEIPVAHSARKTGRVSIARWGLLRACFRSAAELWSFRRVLR